MRKKFHLVASENVEKKPQINHAQNVYAQAPKNKSDLGNSHGEDSSYTDSSSEDDSGSYDSESRSDSEENVQHEKLANYQSKYKKK